MLINIDKMNFPSHNIFRFVNYWLEHESFIFEIRKDLHDRTHSNPMHALYHVLARVRRNVCSIRQYGLGALAKEIKNIEGQLQALEVDDRLSSNLDLDIIRGL